MCSRGTDAKHAGGSGYLQVQCYRAVLELELEARGAGRLTAVGSVSNSAPGHGLAAMLRVYFSLTLVFRFVVARLSFPEYAAKALKRMDRRAQRRPAAPGDGSRADVFPVVPGEGGCAAASPGASELARDYAAELGQWRVGRIATRGLQSCITSDRSTSAFANPAPPQEFVAFYCLRLCLAPLFESLLTLDRLLHLPT